MSSSLSFESINLNGIKGILVDLDNTFYEYKPAHKEALFAVYQEYKKVHEVSEETFNTLYEQAQQHVKEKIPTSAASHSRLLYFQRFTEVTEKKTNMELALHLEKIYWDTFYKVVVLRKDLIIFLQQCREKSIKICILTDLTTDVQFRKMVALGLHTLVDFVVTSEETGEDKPSKSMFLTALEKLNLKKEEVIMIGDDITKDIDGARKQNITAYLI